MEQNFQVAVSHCGCGGPTHYLCRRCDATFQNYLNYARIGCLLANRSDAVFNEKMPLARARMAIRKRGDFIPRGKMWIRLPTLQMAVEVLLRVPEWRLTVMWALTAYAFMLRWAWRACVC